MKQNKIIWTTFEIYKKYLNLDENMPQEKQFLDADETRRRIKDKWRLLKDNQKWIISEILLELEK